MCVTPLAGARTRLAELLRIAGVLDACTAGSDKRNGANSAQVEALCIAQGVPAALLPDYEDSVGFFQGVYGGNPDLDPETADTLTIGLVLRSWSERLLWSSMQLTRWPSNVH